VSQRLCQSSNRLLSKIERTYQWLRKVHRYHTSHSMTSSPDKSLSRWQTFIVLDPSGHPRKTYDLDDRGRLQPRLPQKRRRFDGVHRPKVPQAPVPDQTVILSHLPDLAFDPQPEPSIIAVTTVASTANLDRQGLEVDLVNDGGFFEYPSILENHPSLDAEETAELFSDPFGLW
jgi:hypothetical protein